MKINGLGALGLMTEDSWLSVLVYQRGSDIQQQHGKGNGIRIATPGADTEYDGADGGAVDELPISGGTGTDRIGGDKKCT